MSTSFYVFLLSTTNLQLISQTVFVFMYHRFEISVNWCIASTTYCDEKNNKEMNTLIGETFSNSPFHHESVTLEIFNLIANLTFCLLLRAKRARKANANARSLSNTREFTIASTFFDLRQKLKITGSHF